MRSLPKVLRRDDVDVRIIPHIVAAVNAKNVF
jgi:hypothetical protein